MKKLLALFVSVLLVLCLCTACGEESRPEPAEDISSSAPVPGSQDKPESRSSEAPAPDSRDQTEQPDEPSAAESTAENSGDDTPAAPAASLRFDPKLYQDPNSDDIYNVLAYATNTGEKPAMATVRYKAFDKDGNALSVFDLSKGRNIEEFRTTLYIPAGVEEFPVAFGLSSGFKVDFATGEEMPEIDHMDFEVLDVLDADAEDLRDHFLSGAGEPEIRENHIYIYVKLDDEIAENYSSVYPNYTLLGMTGNEVTAVSCANYFPYGTASLSVSYAKEHNDGSLLIYHRVPSEPVDTWQLYIGCVGAQK